VLYEFCGRDFGLFGLGVVMGEIAKVMILIGAVLIAVGLAILFFPRLPFVGKLPGDILVKKEHFTFYFPPWLRASSSA
jgi:hypothetical protein